MLSAADAELVRRDPSLPGLAAVLDAEALAAALQRAAPEVHVGPAAVTYVRYKPAVSCLVGCRFEVSGVPVDAYAVAYRPAGHRRGSGALRSHLPGLDGPRRIDLREQAVTLSVFPRDGKLEALPRLVDDAARAHVISKLVPERAELRGATLQPIRYKPERRYVARLDRDAHPLAALKVYDEAGYRAARVNAKVFASRGPLRLARRLGRSDRHRVVMFEWIPDRPLREALLDRSPRLDGIATVGAALAELHAQDPKGLALRTRESEAVGLLAVAAGLAFLCPPLAERALHLAGRLVRRLVDAPDLNLPIHGDFYADQVLLAADGASILDLDRAARGDPAADLGQFVAHLEREVLRGTLRPARVQPVRTALLDGYRRASRRPLPERVELYAAAGLLRLAPEPFRRREPDWADRIAAIIERAEAILDGAEATTVGGARDAASTGGAR